MTAFLFDPGPTLPEGWSRVDEQRWAHADGWRLQQTSRAGFALRGPMGERVRCSERLFWPSFAAVSAWVADRQGQNTLF